MRVISKAKFAVVLAIAGIFSGCVASAVKDAKVSAPPGPISSDKQPAVKETVVKTPVATVSSQEAAAPSEYRIGADDELEISVYGDKEAGADPLREYRIVVDDVLAVSVYGDRDLAKDQSVRPDGKIEFPLAGELQASGLTPDELRDEITKRLSKYVRNPQVSVIIKEYQYSKLSVLRKAQTQTVRPDGKIELPLAGEVQASGLTPQGLREQITQRLSKFFKNPQVTVIITKYNSKKVGIVGEVTKPGLLRLSSDISLMEAISRAEGVTQKADLRGAMLVRGGRILPIDFEKLLRQGDFTQNVLVQSNDVILIPNVSAKRVFILGEVSQNREIILDKDISLLQSIALAGGFSKVAEKSNVLIVRGGLASPKLMEINAQKIINERQITQDVLLQPGDIVYVPKTVISDIVELFADIRGVLDPFLVAFSGITLGPDVVSVLTTGKTLSQRTVGVAVSP
jgi:polysaccharide export outer membrane protein